MKYLGRYLGKNALLSTMAALTVVVGFDLLAEFIQQSEQLGSTYTATEILRYLLLSAPGRIREYIPFAALLGCLGGLGILARSNELTAMQAGGLSASRLAWQALRPLLVLSCAGILLAQWPAPAAQQQADLRRAALLEGGAHTAALWYREGASYVHFAVPAPRRPVLETFIDYRVSDGEIASISRAERAEHKDGQWRLEGVTGMSLEGEAMHPFQHAQQSWDTALAPEELRLLLASTAHQSPLALLRHARHLEQRGLDGAPHRLAFWRIVLQPFTTAGLVLLAIAFLFGPLRGADIGIRVMMGLAAGLLFGFFQGMVGAAALVFHITALWAMLALPLLCIGAGLLLLRRAD